MSIEFEVREFNYDLTLGGATAHIKSAVIVIPNGVHFDDGTPMDCVVYAEDDDGNLLCFSTVEEAQEWIDKYKDNLSWHIEHGDELHATPTIKR